MPGAPCHLGKLGASAFAAIGVRRVRGADDDHRGACVALSCKLGPILPDSTRLGGIDRRRLGPAALNIAKGIGTDPRGLAAFWRQARLDQVGETVAESTRAG